MGLIHLFLVCLIGPCLLMVVHGWGKGGHYITCSIAESLFSEATIEVLKVLLPEYKEGRLATICAQSDILQQSKHFHSLKRRSLHYAHTPDFQCTYNHKRDCYDSHGNMDMCIVGAINNLTTELAAFGSKDHIQYNMTDILILLARLVADIHQPLHLGFMGDEGGNGIELWWYLRKTNLHKVWDSLIIGKSKRNNYGSNLDAIVESLIRSIRENWKVASKWGLCHQGEITCPIVYARESIRMACTWAYKDAYEGAMLGDKYLLSRLPIVQQQLSKGGVRLAAIFNRLFVDYKQPLFEVPTYNLTSTSSASPCEGVKKESTSLDRCSEAAEMPCLTTIPPLLGPMAMFQLQARPVITLLQARDILQLPETKLGSGLFCDVFKVQVTYPSFTDDTYAAKLMTGKYGGTKEPQTLGALECTKLSFAHPSIISPIAYHRRSKNTILLFRYWNGSHLKHWNKLAFWNSSSSNSFQDDFIKLPSDEAWLERVRQQAIQLIYALCTALHNVHEHGILHNDLHAGNILLHFSSKNENVYLGVSDWGKSMEMSTATRYRPLYSSETTRDVENRRARRPHVAPECFSHDPPVRHVTHEFYSMGLHISNLLHLHNPSTDAEYMFSQQLQALALQARDLDPAKRAGPADFLKLFEEAAKYGIEINEFTAMRPDDE